jgi:hypothetical protein
VTQDQMLTLDFVPLEDPARLIGPRVALCAVFATHGFVFASWAVRVPAIKQQTGASAAAARSASSAHTRLAVWPLHVL